MHVAEYNMTVVESAPQADTLYVCVIGTIGQYVN